jgi:hypothetical protein
MKGRDYISLLATGSIILYLVILGAVAYNNNSESLGCPSYEA